MSKQNIQVSKNNTERRHMTIEFRANEDKESRTVTGYAATFNEWTDMYWYDERIAPGAFRDAIGISDIRALFNHDPNHLLARTTNNTLMVEEDGTGLRFTFDMPESRNDLLELIRNGTLSGCSFAFTVEKDEWEYNQDDDKDKRTITKVAQLFDVGPVTYPAYDTTSISARTKQKIDQLIEQRSKQDNDDDDAIKISSEQMELEIDLLNLKLV